MASARNLHAAPFDDDTVTKLEIFENYAREWLPVFVKARGVDRVAIWDFFAGPGTDKKGNPGSPARIVSVLGEHMIGILQEKLKVDVHLNELRPSKYARLEKFVVEAREGPLHKLRVLVSVHTHRRDFQDLLTDKLTDLRAQPNLIFIDQNGGKEVTPQVFDTLASLEATDFLFFVSSSYFRRFAAESAFRERFPDLDPALVQQAAYADVHRVMLEYYRGRIPEGSELRLFPFSIKKGSNIYGLIFGSRHLLGVDKFLRVAWNKNKINGEANFDIDTDAPFLESPHLPGMARLTKMDRFHRNLEAFMIERGEVTNQDVCRFALENGHIPPHAKDLVMRLRKEGRLVCDARIGFSHNTCYKKRSIRPIRIVSNG